MTTLIFGFTAFAGPTIRLCEASFIRSRRKALQLRAPLAWMSLSDFVVVKKKSSRISSSKRLGREADDLLHVLPVGRARVAELLELEALVGDQGDPARRLDPPALEEALDLEHGLAVVRHPAAVGLEVDLADLQVLREGLEVLLEPIALRHATDVVHPAVDRQLEVAVARGLGHGGRGQQGRRERGSPERASVEHLHPPNARRLYATRPPARERQRHHPGGPTACMLSWRREQEGR